MGGAEYAVRPLYDLVDAIQKAEQELPTQRILAIGYLVGATVWLAATVALIAATIFFWPASFPFLWPFLAGYMTQVAPLGILAGAVAFPIMAIQNAYEVFSENELNRQRLFYNQEMQAWAVYQQQQALLRAL